ncbi:MAG: hypothetical protein IJ078_04740 [Succinivibrionaceae bacterium]|nr:hypothetical protein [Succinivibrionaceae bacterium]
MGKAVVKQQSKKSNDYHSGTLYHKMLVAYTKPSGKKPSAILSTGLCSSFSVILSGSCSGRGNFLQQFLLLTFHNLYLL